MLFREYSFVNSAASAGQLWSERNVSTRRNEKQTGDSSFTHIRIFPLIYMLKLFSLLVLMFPEAPQFDLKYGKNTGW